MRDVAPNALVLGNLGVVQARQMSTGAIQELCKEVGVDALCVHLQPVDGADPAGRRSRLPRRARDAARGCTASSACRSSSRRPARACRARVGLALKQLGIRAVDTSGAGGTSWVGVETKRAEGDGQASSARSCGTGASRRRRRSGCCADLGLDIIATGGLRNGQDVAHALALGATAGGLAAPVLRAHRDGGYDGVVAFLEHVIDGVRAATFLTGCRTPAELRTRAAR